VQLTAKKVMIMPTFLKVLNVNQEVSIAVIFNFNFIQLCLKGRYLKVMLAFVIRVNFYFEKCSFSISC